MASVKFFYIKIKSFSEEQENANTKKGPSWLKTTRRVSYKVEQWRDIQEKLAAELHKFAYGLFDVCAFDPLL